MFQRLRWRKEWKGNWARVSLKRFHDLERHIGYRFKQPQLLFTALKHRSFLDTSGEDRLLSNERLEFLGDAVLDLVVSDYLYNQRSSEEEGVLTGVKSIMVSGPVLVTQARKIDLGKYLLLSDNEERSGGRNRDSILEDTFEALIGALYLDGGLKTATKFIKRFLLADTADILEEKDLMNYKSILLEYAQGNGLEPPIYNVIEETGPDHDKRYQVEVRLGDRILGTGWGRTKKQAEQKAAAEGVKKVQFMSEDK